MAGDFMDFSTFYKSRFHPEAHTIRLRGGRHGQDRMVYEEGALSNDISFK